jgi:hypothetical protein
MRVYSQRRCRLLEKAPTAALVYNAVLDDGRRDRVEPSLRHIANSAGEDEPVSVAKATDLARGRLAYFNLQRGPTVQGIQ